jgi:hypothetical protein
MSEAVVLLFIQKNSVLLASFVSENRLTYFFIPREIIDDKERQQKHYVEHAMHKVVYRAFHGTVMPLQYELVDTLSSEEGVQSHLYFIYSWDGDLPTHIQEQGNTKAKLQWISIDKALELEQNENDKAVLSLAKESIRIKHLLRRGAV